MVKSFQNSKGIFIVAKVVRMASAVYGHEGLPHLSDGGLRLARGVLVVASAHGTIVGGAQVAGRFQRAKQSRPGQFKHSAGLSEWGEHGSAATRRGSGNHQRDQ